MDDSGRSAESVLPLGFLARLATRQRWTKDFTRRRELRVRGYAGRNGAPTNKSLAKYPASAGDWCRAQLIEV